VINGERFAWKQGDTFSAPVFARVEHAVASDLFELRIPKAAPENGRWTKKGPPAVIRGGGDTGLWFRRDQFVNIFENLDHFVIVGTKAQFLVDEQRRAIEPLLEPHAAFLIRIHDAPLQHKLGYYEERPRG
jgi:hypothetical protein